MMTRPTDRPRVKLRRARHTIKLRLSWLFLNCNVGSYLQNIQGLSSILGSTILENIHILPLLCPLIMLYYDVWAKVIPQFTVAHDKCHAFSLFLVWCDPLHSGNFIYQYIFHPVTVLLSPPAWKDKAYSLAHFPSILICATGRPGWSNQHKNILMLPEPFPLSFMFIHS